MSAAVEYENVEQELRAEIRDLKAVYHAAKSVAECIPNMGFPSTSLKERVKRLNEVLKANETLEQKREGVE